MHRDPSVQNDTNDQCQTAGENQKTQGPQNVHQLDPHRLNETNPSDLRPQKKDDQATDEETPEPALG